MTWDPSWGWMLACAFVAEVIGTMAGFGAATILTPVAAQFMDIKTAVVLVAVFHLCGNLSRLVFFGRHVHWKIWALFGLTGIACSWFGATVASGLPSSAITLAFGIFLLVYVAMTAVGAERWQLPSHPATLIGGGVFSGFIAGLIGTGGAIRSVCLLVFNLSKEGYVGTSAALALLVDGTRLPVYLTRRMLPASMVRLTILLVPVAFAGAWVGQRLVRRVSPVAFRRFVLFMLAAMGGKLLWDGLR